MLKTGDIGFHPAITHDLFLRVKLEELITRREGMIADNRSRTHKGLSPAYTEDAFDRLAKEIRGLIREYEDTHKQKAIDL
jgi:hypothetical protein